MARNHPLNIREVLHIVDLHCTTDLYQAEIAQLCRCSQATVSRVCSQYDAYVPVQDIVKPPRAGQQREASRVLDATERNALAGIVNGRQTLYLQEMADALHAQTGKLVSTSTICRELARMGITRKKVGSPPPPPTRLRPVPQCHSCRS